MMKKILGLAATAALALGASAAQAVTINGAITFSGHAVTTTPSGSTLATATGIDFINNTSSVDIALGDLSSFANAAVTMQDFTFSPSFTGINGFYTVAGGLSFDLDTVAIQQQDSAFLNLVGTGKWHLSGYDDTDAAWTFTVTSSGVGQFTVLSAGTTTASVPEPATLGLLGLGLAGVGIVRRRRKA